MTCGKTAQHNDEAESGFENGKTLGKPEKQDNITITLEKKVKTVRETAELILSRTRWGPQVLVE